MMVSVMVGSQRFELLSFSHEILVIQGFYGALIKETIDKGDNWSRVCLVFG